MQNGERRRVVVTGLGMITPLGSTVEKTWDGIIAGRSGIGPITRFDATGLDTRIAGEVRDFDPLDYMDRKEIRRSDRFVHFAVAAAGQALRSARIEITPELAPRIGVAFGSGIGGVETLVDQVLIHDKDPRKVSPFLIPMMIIDMAAGEIAMKYRAKGPNMGHVSACASSANAVGEAAEIIRRGQADVMLAGGAEAGLIKIAIGAFNQARALSTRNDAPEKASRPFDKDRDGFVFSEGAGCLVLDDLDDRAHPGRRRRDRSRALHPRHAEWTSPAHDQSGDAGSGMRPRLRTEPRAKGEGRPVALELHGVRRAQRRARHKPRGRRMPDPRKVRADANALVAELLERLAHAEVSELEV